MIDKKYIELIEKEIDGTITPEEKARLRKGLEKDAEAQKSYQEQIQVSRLLHQIPTIEPPPGLKKRIINSVNFKGDTVKIRKPAFRPSIFKKFSKHTPRLAFAFGVGLVLGIFLHMVFFTDQYSMSKSDLMGTIGMHEKGYFNTVTEIPIKGSDVKGVMIITQYRDHLGCEVNLVSTGDVELLVEFDPFHIQFQGFKPFSQSRIVIENGENYIRSSNSAEVHFVSFFSRMLPVATQIEVTLSRKGSVKFHRKIPLEQIEENDETHE